MHLARERLGQGQEVTGNGKSVEGTGTGGISDCEEGTCWESAKSWIEGTANVRRNRLVPAGLLFAHGMEAG